MNEKEKVAERFTKRQNIEGRDRQGCERYKGNKENKVREGDEKEEKKK